jgi:hypothetical protein
LNTGDIGFKKKGNTSMDALGMSQINNSRREGALAKRCCGECLAPL